MNKLIVIGALPTSLTHFRSELLREITKRNFTVIAMASSIEPKVISQLESIKIQFKDYPIQRNGLNPFEDYKTWKFLRAFFIKTKPTVILAYTIKPIIWSGISAKAVPQARYYALITGLGYTFQGKGISRKILTGIATWLYRASLKRANKVIFQNPDNLQEFVNRNIVPSSKCELVNGSGVDIQHYSFSPILEKNPIIFLTMGRLLGEKGFREYAEAAKIVKKQYPETEFQLLGREEKCLDAIHHHEIKEWVNQGWINYLGSTSDVRPFIRKCHIFVLPSHHEGMPRTTLEAMSIGRPVLTTDVPGCRETVVPNKNGFLVPKSDPGALAERMIWFIENPQRWQSMGSYSRMLAEEKFDVAKVNKKIIDILELT